ncbi:MAG TPA: alpha/beta hydrolase-fold protein [Stenotrophomonas sp.]|jgi:predicted alpha/beta superfamily hydrolase
MPPSPSASLQALKWLWGQLTGIDCVPTGCRSPARPPVAAGYRFERLRLASADGSRHWPVVLGIPGGPLPPTGLASFWMMDGQRARAEIDDALLDALSTGPESPLLVFVGHDGDASTLPALRARDYTFRAGAYPFLQAPGVAADRPLGGGADALLEVLERQLWPRLATRLPLDPGRRTLWGHSLAGLFVLHTLLSRPGSFQTYAAGSPSLWWCKGALLGEPLERFVSHNAGRRARVRVYVGGHERQGVACQPGPADAVAAGLRKATTGVAPDAAFALADGLGQVAGLEVACREYPGLDHAPMFRASLLDALHEATQAIKPHRRARGDLA